MSFKRLKSERPSPYVLPDHVLDYTMSYLVPQQTALLHQSNRYGPTEEIMETVASAMLPWYDGINRLITLLRLSYLQLVWSDDADLDSTLASWTDQVRDQSRHLHELKISDSTRRVALVRTVPSLSTFAVAGFDGLQKL